MNTKDSIIVIGGGLGGLFTAAILSRYGFRVTVFEKNHTIGGGLQTFHYHGHVFETGMHLLGAIRPGHSIYKVCDWLGILDQMNIIDMDADCMDQITYESNGYTYRIPQGRERFTNYFQQIFPNEAVGIKAYIDKLYQLVEEIDFFWLRTTSEKIFSHDPMFYWPADAMVKHFLRNEKLRDVISYMNPMYGGVEGHTPAYIAALINVLYIEGASRFRGGSQQMAEALRRVIEQGGGEVRSGEPVTAFGIENRNLVSITTAKGVYSDFQQAVCAIHPLSMLRLTDSKAFSNAYRNRMENAPQSFSTFCIYCVLKPETFPYINHTCYFQRDYGRVWHYGEYEEGAWPQGFMYMTPAETDTDSWASTLIINSPMPFSVCNQWADTFTGHRGADYEQWKQRHIDLVFNQMERLYPHLRQCCQWITASSPLTIRDYYGQPKGSLYGMAHDCQNLLQSQVPIYTKVKNLFMTGQNVNVHGFCGVILTAIKTAEAIVGRNKVTNDINCAYAKTHSNNE